MTFVEHRPRRVGALFARAALVLAIAALPVAFNAWIDPARLVAPRSAERAIASVLASGKNVTDVANHDDRAIGKYLAGLRSSRPEVLVVGSSRMQMLRGFGGSEVRGFGTGTAEPTASPRARAGAGFVNASVQGAVLDDILGMYGVYDTPERRPRRVLLGVDPWTESASGDGWRAVADERAMVARRAGIPVSPTRDRAALYTRAVRTLATPEYFRLSLYSFRRYGTRGIVWRPVDAEQNAEKTKLPDGSVTWSALSAGHAERASREFARSGILHDPRFHDLDHRAAGRRDALEKFVRYLGEAGVSVTLVLVPFPAEVYDAFARMPGHAVRDVERDLRSMAARTGVRVVGSYDPRRVGVTTSDFYDEDHLRPEPLARIVGR